MMTAKNKIRWTSWTWNFVTGYDNCYAETFSERLHGTVAFPNRFDFALKTNVPILTVLAMILISILITGCLAKEPQPDEDITPAQQQEHSPSNARTHTSSLTTTNSTQQNDVIQNDPQTDLPGKSSNPYMQNESPNQTTDTTPVERLQTPTTQRPPTVQHKPDTTGEPAAEATAEIKPITDLPMERPNIPDQPANIWESLSPQEIDCLPDGVHDDQSLIHAADNNQQNPMTAQSITKCLTDENAFMLHMSALSYGMPGISEETQRCIWNAISTLGNIDSPALTDQNNPDPMADFQNFMKVIIGTTAITGYCMSYQEWAIINPIDTNEGHDYTTCMIDSFGGPIQFLEALMDDINALAHAEAICDSNTENGT